MQYIFKFAMTVAQMTTKAVVKTTVLFLKAAMKASFLLFSLGMWLLEAILDGASRAASTCQRWFRSVGKRLS